MNFPVEVELCWQCRLRTVCYKISGTISWTAHRQPSRSPRPHGRRYNCPALGPNILIPLHRARFFGHGQLGRWYLHPNSKRNLYIGPSHPVRHFSHKTYRSWYLNLVSSLPVFRSWNLDTSPWILVPIAWYRSLDPGYWAANPLILIPTSILVLVRDLLILVPRSQ